MELDGKTIASLAAPFVVIALLVAAAFYVPVEKGLTEAEEGMLNFMNAELSIPVVTQGLPKKRGEGPFEFARIQDGEDARVAADRKADGNGLSLIVIGEGKKFAMIGDRLVKEGDRIDDKKIAKIEPDRILVRDRTARWEYLKEE